jgi:glycosyltransferase involved in cell wall biosynthesis
MKRLAIITSHPIQYNAPLFRLLTKRERIYIKVFYTWGQTKEGSVYDPGFGKAFQWDIPLLDGYEHQFIENLSKNPGTSHFRGVVNKHLVPQIEHWRPDAILIYGWSFHSHLKALRYFKGKIPILFRGDSTLLDESSGFSLKKLARRILLRWVYSHVDYCLYPGSANKAYYLRHGIKIQQLIFAPHAVENERFAEADNERNEAAKIWRRELGIKDSELVFLFAGKLEPKKNPITLMKVFQELNLTGTRLVIAGHGVLESELKAIAAGNERIIFLPFQNQQAMPTLYRLGDIFVLSSKGPGETWGLSVNEAMACGLPAIVSTACGCAPELIVEGKTGYVFKSNDKEDLKKAILRMVDKSVVSKMSKIAACHIRKFNLNFLSETIEKVLLEEENNKLSKA